MIPSSSSEEGAYLKETSLEDTEVLGESRELGVGGAGNIGVKKDSGRGSCLSRLYSPGQLESFH